MSLLYVDVVQALRWERLSRIIIDKVKWKRTFTIVTGEVRSNSCSPIPGSSYR